MDDREASPTQLYDALQCLGTAHWRTLAANGRWGGGDAPLLSPVEAEAELEALEGSLHCAAVSVTTLQSKFRPRRLYLLPR